MSVRKSSNSISSCKLPARSHPTAAVRDSGFNTPSLDRALAVLQCLSAHPSGLTLSELAAHLGFPLNFVYRVAQSLAAHGYAVRDSERRFTVGGRLLELCQPVVDDVPLTEAALPAMRWLSEQTGEAAHLGIISGREGIVIERVIGRAPIKFYVERGTRFPLHTSAPGKAILAFLPQSEREALLAQIEFERFHPWTVSCARELRGLLPGIRAKGYATDVGEHLEGHHCVGVPILGADSSPVAGLWVTGPSMRLCERRMESLAPVLLEAGAMASTALSPVGANLSVHREPDSDLVATDAPRTSVKTRRRIGAQKK